VNGVELPGLSLNTGKPETLELKFGTSRWLNAAHLGISALGAVAILVAPTNWGWKLLTLFGLVFATLIGLFQSRADSRSGTVILHLDGTSRVITRDGKAVRARLNENAWVSRWLCVLKLFEPRRSKHYHCVICASENSPDEYRRLLKFLNMRSSATVHQKATWY
jgi:hypothetical protein